MKNDYYVRTFRGLLKQKHLDAIIIYANAYDDRYMKALSGTYSVLQNHFLITASSLYISEARYLVNHLKLRTSVPLLAANGENQTIDEMRNKIKKKARIGFVGACKYIDLITFGAKEYIDLTKEADQIIQYKPDEYIDALSQYASKLAVLMDSSQNFQLKQQTYLAQMFTKSVIDLGCSLSFPICVTSGNDIKHSTTMLAQNKIIQAKDIVCIDMGLRNDIFTTDRTRMYFLNQEEPRQLYEEIKNVHANIISTFINPDITFRNVINEYKRRFSHYSEIKTIEEEDFGHGVGFALHEQPMLEETKAKIGTNIVFTIEPTFDTVFGKMRIEDMVAVRSDGTIMNLTM